MLGALEDRRRGQAVAVIGVHSAKFDAENDPARIRAAMERHAVRHPVVVDAGHRVWQAYAVRSWPTLVVVAPDGTVAAVAPGEAELEPLDAFVGTLLDEARAAGTLARAPLAIEALPAEAPGPLAFPGKVIALPGGGLALSDTRHHRLVVTGPDGIVRHVVGSGRPGLADGPLAEARFQDPQGLAASGSTLVVADTGNHAIRAVDLEAGRVTTLAGTGELGRGIPRGPLAARAVALRSPWDVVVAGDYVLVAMAGTHQVWALDLRRRTIRVFAGTGRESIDDGSFAAATFAQPSGLALSDHRLYVADSETSAVRVLDLSRGQVKTLVGRGLFDFGFRDGPREEALLQHPLAVSHGPQGLLVADTYNDAIRRVDEETGEVRTWWHGGDGVALREPGGLCQREDGTVVVADTSHHRLVEIDDEGRSARVLPLAGLQPPLVAVPAPAPAVPAEEEELEPVEAAPGGVPLRLALDTPRGLELAEGSPVAITLEGAAGLVVPGDPVGFTVEGERRTVDVDLHAAAPGTWRVRLLVEAVVCGKGDAAACWPVRGAYVLSLRVSEGMPARRAAVDVPLPDPRPD